MKDVDISYEEGMKELGSDRDPLNGLKGKKKSMDDIMISNQDDEDHNLQADVGGENLEKLGPSDTDLIDTTNFN